MAEITVPPDVAEETEHAGPPRPLDFEIVPLKGLPIVAVIMGLLIAAIASNKLWPLTFFHVAGGAAWTIIDLFLGLVLGPIMGKMSVPARIEFTTKLMPKMVPPWSRRRSPRAGSWPPTWAPISAPIRCTAGSSPA
jgi:hypothetical protein